VAALKFLSFFKRGVGDVLNFGTYGIRFGERTKCRRWEDKKVRGEKGQRTED